MIVFIVLNPNGGYTRKIARAVEHEGYQTKIFSWKNFDYNLIHQLDPHKSLIFFRTGATEAIRIARTFEDAGFNIINDSRYIQLSGQKYLANVYANVNGIPTPNLNVTLMKYDTDLLLLYLKQNGPLVAKPIYSRDMGRYVFKISNEDDFSVVQTIPGSHILLQSEVKFKRLVRTVVTSDGMLVDATSYDTIHNDTWKATVCENPHIKHYCNLPNELIELSEKTIKVFGGDIAYIDYFETSNGFVFNEINHSCGLREQERVTGISIAKYLANFLIQKLKN